MNVGVIQFPGSNDERDAVWAVLHLGGEAQLVWHGASSLGDVDAIVLPGGFSYGDYLRCGAIARFSRVMGAVRREAARGKLVIGSCNGFQILCEAGLLPGVLMRNHSTQFRCQDVYLRVETDANAF